jgi:hypothetical protein
VTFALLLLSIIPRDDCVRESVELIEVNHVYDLDGNQHLTQTIFWNARDVIAWRMNNEGRLTPSGKVLYFMDAGVVRCITARTVAESWTMYDVEVAARDLLPANERRGLRK